MTREQELLERIQSLEEQNSILQDKLDMIYAILSPDYEEEGDDDDSGPPPSNLVQIKQ